MRDVLKVVGLIAYCNGRCYTQGLESWWLDIQYTVLYRRVRQSPLSMFVSVTDVRRARIIKNMPRGGFRLMNL
jgi:hypothetical protein